jgi:hypothetical protein
MDEGANQADAYILVPSAALKKIGIADKKEHE